MEIEGFEEIQGSEIIQDTFLFQGLNFSEAQALAKICHRERRSSGEVIIEENALGQALYLIEQGEVKVIKGEGAEQHQLARLGRGELFGEMSLVENELTSASVVAATDVELLVVHRPEFEELLEQDQGLALKVYKSFCRTLSERLRKTTEELSRIHSKQGGQKRRRAGSGAKPAGKRKGRSGGR
jgi:CRP-like cAMP-binding protein